MYTLFSGIVNNIVDRSIAKSSLLFLGIDGAGKTTLIEKIMQHVLPNRKPKTIRQTMGLNTDTINDKKVSLRIWDLGGKKDFRSIWFNYMTDATAVVYVVNAKQEERIHEARKILDDIICKYQKDIALVFLNADETVLNIFPAADQANAKFFIDVENKDDIMNFYQWMKSTATK